MEEAMQDSIEHPAEIVPVPAAARDGTSCTLEQYEAMYRRSVEDPDGFWAEQAARLDWFRAPTRIAEWSYDPVDIKWFSDGQLNICHNALDRHVAAGKGDVTALIFEPDNPQGTARKLTYAELLAETIRRMAFGESVSSLYVD